jgi:N-methylhydantoinase A
VCFLWSFRNPAHERRVQAIARALQPRLHVSCSADLFPVMREYERMTATVLNAYTWRAFSVFLDAVESRLAAAGLRVRVAVMHSNGGTIAPAEARAKPIFLAQSGPVAGVAAAQALAHGAGLSDVITGDMGGTSFDVAVIQNGVPSVGQRAELFGLWTGMSMVRSARSARAGAASPGATRAASCASARAAPAPSRDRRATGAAARSRR